MSKEEVEQVIPFLNSNVLHIGKQMKDSSIRSAWKNTRSEYSRIDSDGFIDYSNSVIAAYSIGTTPIHVFLLNHILSSHVELLDNMHIVCLCGGSGAELLSFSLLGSQQKRRLHLTIIDKEPMWKSSSLSYCPSI